MTDYAPTTTGRVRRLLDSRGLDAGLVNDLLDSFYSAGLLGPEENKLHAAAVRSNNATETHARAVAARLSLPISASGSIDPNDITRATKGESVEQRLRYRSLFHAAGMIP